MMRQHYKNKPFYLILYIFKQCRFIFKCCTGALFYLILHSLRFV